MQRLHEDDLVGHVLKQEGWEIVSFPAIAEVDEQRVVETPFGRKAFFRVTGAELHPERDSLETLQRIRATIGEYNFAGQYQQTPAPAGGGIKEAWFRRYRPEERPASFDQVVQSLDTANKPSELADYSVCTTWASRAALLSAQHPAQKARLSQPQTGSPRTRRSLQSDDHPDRRQGVRDATDPGPRRRGPFARHSLQARRRQDQRKPQPSRTASSTCPKPLIGSPIIFMS
jgi:hypothetical protein